MDANIKRDVFKGNHDGYNWRFSFTYPKYLSSRIGDPVEML